jgi:hypothetical protein
MSPNTNVYNYGLFWAFNLVFFVSLKGLIKITQFIVIIRNMSQYPYPQHSCSTLPNLDLYPYIEEKTTKKCCSCFLFNIWVQAKVLNKS